MIPLEDKTDIVFLIDTANGVTAEILAAEKSFVKSLARLFGVSPRGPRGSAVMYGSNTYTLSRLSEPEFERRVDRASLRGTTRRMDVALERAAQILSNSVGRKVVVLLTAGKQGSTGKPLEDAILPLRDLGAHTYVVAIGRKPSAQEIAKIIRGPQEKFQVDSYGRLQLNSQRIATSIQKKPSKSFL